MGRIEDGKIWIHFASSDSDQDMNTLNYSFSTLYPIKTDGCKKWNLLLNGPFVGDTHSFNNPKIVKKKEAIVWLWGSQSNPLTLIAVQVWGEDIKGWVLIDSWRDKGGGGKKKLGHNLSSWWLNQPLWNILVKMGIFSR